MEKIEKAREIFRSLEGDDVGCAGDVARRNFCIQERLAEIRC